MQVTDKQLVPNKFGLDDTPIELASLVKKVTAKLDILKKQKEITPAVYDACLYLIDNSAKGSSRFSAQYTGLTEKEYLIILKDFGEISGAIYMLKHGPDYRAVKFPTAANERLIDYTLVKTDGFEEKFSAKQGEGGKPSVTSVMPIISELEKSNKLSPRLKKAAQVLMHISTEEKNGLYFGPLRAAVFLKLPGYIELLNLLKTLKVSNQTTLSQATIPSPDDLLDAVNRCGTYKSCLEKMDKFFVASGYKANLNEAVTKRLIETPREGKEKKWGILHYPVTAELVKWLNDPSNGATELLTQAANSLTVTQIYLDLRGSNLEYTVKGFSDAQFEFGSPSSAPRPTNNRIGFKMKKAARKLG